MVRSQHSLQLGFQSSRSVSQRGRSPSKQLQAIMPLGAKSPPQDYIAVVTVTISPLRHGRVELHGIGWPAYCESEVTLVPDTLVWVVDINGTKLVVQPLDNWQ